METPSCMPGVLPSACSTPAPNFALPFFKSAASGGPVVATLPSSAYSFLGRGAKISHASWPKKQNTQKNRSNITTNSIKTLKVAHGGGRGIIF